MCIRDRLLGLLPLLFKRCVSSQQPGAKAGKSKWDVAISCLSCFGGGVILATCLTHMLPEVNEMVEHNVATGSMPDTGRSKG